MKIGALNYVSHTNRLRSATNRYYNKRNSVVDAPVLRYLNVIFKEANMPKNVMEQIKPY